MDLESLSRIPALPAMVKAAPKAVTQLKLKFLQELTMVQDYVQEAGVMLVHEMAPSVIYM